MPAQAWMTAKQNRGGRGQGAAHEMRRFSRPLTAPAGVAVSLITRQRRGKEGHDLPAGAGQVGREGGFTGAVGYALFHSPVDRAGSDIREAGLSGIGTACLLPHELHCHSTCAGVLRGKGGAAGHALFSSPCSGFFIVAACRHIRKGDAAFWAPESRRLSTGR